VARSKKAKSSLNPLTLARHNALYKGLLGGNRTWLVIGAVVWAPRLMKRLLGKNEEIVATEKLLPGSSIRITALPQRTKADRKRFTRSK
jgi:hypothetical protein